MITPILIPYKLQKDSEELRLTLRSIEKNAKFDYKIVLLGDAPSWINTDQVEVTSWKPQPHPIYPSFFDTQQKNFNYISKNDDFENFVWTNDDIIFNKEITLELLNDPVALQKLVKFEKSDASKKWVDTLMRTRHVLITRFPDKQLYNFATHTPYLFNRKKMIQLFINYLMDINIYNMCTLYYNTYELDRVKVLREDANWDKTGIYNAKSLNDFVKNGSPNHYINWGCGFWTENLKRKLYQLYPEKSKFEI